MTQDMVKTTATIPDVNTQPVIAQGKPAPSPPPGNGTRALGRKAAFPSTRPSQFKKSEWSQDGGGRSEVSKADIVLKKLRLTRGATIAQIIETTSWQAHSVRGFLSAVVRKKLGLNLISEVGKDGQRRYRIVKREVA